MSTDKEPDYKGIAERLAEKYGHTSIVSEDWTGATLRARGYASCMEARLRSDWETIRLLKRLPHTFKCGVEWTSAWGIIAEGRVKSGPCTCGLSAHLSKLLEPFTP